MSEPAAVLLIELHLDIKPEGKMEFLKSEVGKSALHVYEHVYDIAIPIPEAVKS